jgi:hypothetical protein
VEGLRQELRTLPEVSTQEEMMEPWIVRECILGVGQSATVRLGRWEAALTLNAELVAITEGRGAPALAMASARFNAHGPLLRLGRLADARALLEACRESIEGAGDVRLLGMLFSALAQPEDHLDHPDAARTFEETALRYDYLTGGAWDCALSHFNLAIYLCQAGSPPAVALAHRLASAILDFQAGTGQLPSTLQALARHVVAVAPAPLPLPASFEALCDIVERVEGVRFRELVERLPRRAPTGEAALAEVIRLVQEQTASATDE